MKLLLATRNREKAKEIKELLKEIPFEMVSLPELSSDFFIEEEGMTIFENALLKAKKCFEEFNLPVLAEDTGLMVFSLGGIPGVYSSRFAGEGATYEANRKKLLKWLENFPFEKRRAMFLTCVVMIDSKGVIHSTEGRVEGFIVNEERGEEGFGYDPIFLYPPLGRTFGELPLELKNKVSHRGKALRQAKKILWRIYESCISR